jgi:hypothetical protein
MNEADEAARQSSHASVSFPSSIAKYLYREDCRHAPGLLVFVEARMVAFQRRCLAQLTVHNCRHRASNNEQDKSRARNDVFLFVEQIKPRLSGGCPCGGPVFSHESMEECCEEGVRSVRAFSFKKVQERALNSMGVEVCSTRHVLCEQKDQGIVMRAWREFILSPVAECVQENEELGCESDWDFLGINHLEREGMRACAESLCKRLDPFFLRWLREGLHSHASIFPVCTLSSYSMQEESFSGGGEMVFSSCCNIMSGHVQVPCVAPAWRVIPDYRPPSLPASSLGMHGCSMQDFMDIVDNDGALVMNGPKIAVPTTRSHLTFIAASRDWSIWYLVRQSMVVCTLLDCRLFRFSDGMPDAPLKRLERKGIMHAHGVCVDESDLQSKFGDGCSGGEGAGAKASLPVCYCKGLRYSEAERVHDDVLPTPVLLLSEAAKWLQ